MTDPEPEIRFNRASPARIKEAIMESNRAFDRQARGTRWQARRHWTSYLEPAIIIAALVGLFCTIVWGLMGCSSDGPGDGGDGGGGRDGGALGDGGTDGRSAGDAGRVPDGAVTVDGGALPVDAAVLWPDGAPPVTWTGAYALTWTLISNTCSVPYKTGGAYDVNPTVFGYTEPQTTAIWSNPNRPTTAELARDFTWLYTGGKPDLVPPGVSISATTWVQGPPRTITGQVVMSVVLSTGGTCDTTWGVKGVRQ